ncbi:MAG: biopolymer transporter ExbD [Chitinophagales bacterium]|nr:biopolymer transporter ExbD [Chitinophagales bacterium]
MANSKKKPSSPKLDMNPMVDLAFLLVTFFMLTTTFKTEEPIIVETPNSTSEIKIPEKNIAVITVNEEGRIFYGIDSKYARQNLLKMMGNRYGINFSEDQIESFSLIPSIGVEISQLKSLLELRPIERKRFIQEGIPIDSLNNQFADWVIHSRMVNPKTRFAIKGDEKTNYPQIKQIIDVLVKNKVTRFNLITDKEEGIETVES